MLRTGEMDVATQTEGIGMKHFLQQTGEDAGKWIEEDDDVVIIKEINPTQGKTLNKTRIINPLEKKRAKNQSSQTARMGKDKAIQTDWVLRKIEVGDSRRSSREAVLLLLSRHHFFSMIQEHFTIPEIVSPMKEDQIEEEWKNWKVGEFLWEFKKKDEKENQISQQTNNPKKRKTTMENDKIDVVDVEEESTGGDNENQQANNEMRSDKDDRMNRKRIKKEDLETLDEGKCLNDEIINSYLDLICKRETFGQRVYGMNSFFFPRLYVNGYPAIKRWTKKVNLFEFEKVMVPIHLGHHWCLAVIDLKKKTISYYDSLGGENPQYLENLFQYLILEAGEKGKIRPRREE
ncbi:sentrin-specific protease 1-like [Venturia canescens]|uniref:sentrin-specific protease 1-like n=1 Tax=Venturia canescens TaxID=32260 RepID=UPI001C9CB410|nr:sentrin-specific protease 1-like [Venturia canescens]